MATSFFRRWTGWGLVWLVALVSQAAAQMEHHPDKHIHAGRQTAAAAVSTFRGKFDSNSHTLRGLQELEYINRSDSHLTAISVRIPSDGDFVIDSILLFGVPLDSSDIARDKDILSLSLPQSVPPGQAAFFLISFHFTPRGYFHNTRETMAWVNWLPGIVDEVDDSVTTGGCGGTRIVATRSYVDLEVDSSLRVYSGAELLNEKEMLGLLPPGEGLVTDIFARGLAIDLQSAYQSLFTSGTRRYFLRFDTDDGCPLLLGLPTRVDRITLDSLQLEIVHPPKTSPRDARRFSESVFEIVTNLRDRFILTDNRRAMVFPSDYQFPRLSASSIGTNRDVMPWSCQRVDVVSAVTRWWWEDYGERTEFTRGLVNYLALATVFDLHGAAAAHVWQAQHDPEKWARYRRGHSNFRPPECADMSELSRESSADTAIRWHTLRQLLGESAFVTLVDSVVRHNPASVKELSTWTAAYSDMPLKSLFEVWPTERFEQAIHLNAAAISREPQSGDWVVTASVLSEGVLALPVEIAVVFAAGDTLLDTLHIDQGQLAATYLSPPFREAPDWLILDPFYRLPDFDRRDNIGRLRVLSRPRLFLPRAVESLGAVIFERP